MRREEGGTEAEEGKLLLNEIRTGSSVRRADSGMGGGIGGWGVSRVGGVLGVGELTHVTCGV